MTEIIRLPSRPRARFTWLLPSVFVVGSTLGSVWSGHAGQLFVVGALVGVWACFLLPNGADAGGWLLPTLLGGVPILLLFGWLLDRLRADLWLYAVAGLLVSAIAGYALLQGYGDFGAALDHHGGFLAYLICALQLGSYGATLLVLMVQAGRGAVA